MRQAMMFSKRGTSSAEVAAAIDAARVNPYPFLATCDLTQADANSGTIGANALRMTRLPRLAESMSTTRASLFVMTASGNFDIAVLASTNGGTTLTRVASTGSVAAAGASAVQTANLAMSWNADTDYWAAVAADNGTLAILRVNNAATNYDSLMARNKETGSAASSFPIPATLTTHTWGYASKFYVLFD